MGLFGNDSDHEDNDSRVKRKKLTVIKFDAQELLAAGWTAEQVTGVRGRAWTHCMAALLGAVFGGWLRR
jgi:hypothetical protein